MAMILSAFHNLSSTSRGAHERSNDLVAQPPQSASPAQPATTAAARGQAVNHNNSIPHIEGQGRQARELRDFYQRQSQPRILRRHVTEYEPGELVAMGFWILFIIITSAILSSPLFQPIQTHDCPDSSQTRYTCTQDAWFMIILLAMYVGGVVYWLREHFISNPLAKLPNRIKQCGIASTPFLMIFVVCTVLWAAGAGHGCFKGCI